MERYFELVQSLLQNTGAILTDLGFFTSVWFTGESVAVTQGWKLHVAPRVAQAEAALERCIPVLAAHRVPFKFVSSHGGYASMNAVMANRSQVGKFITAYPVDDRQAVALAAALDQATEGLSGPLVPSDRQLRPGSIVHYRYGEFTPAYRQALEANIVSILTGPGGEETEEKRNPWFSPPSWAANPFVAAGLSTAEQPGGSGPIGTRYQVKRALKQAARGGVYIAADTSVTPNQQCLLKEARAFIGEFPDTDEDIRDVVLREYQILKQLESNPCVPRVFDMFEQENNRYVVREAIAGRSLSSVFTRGDTPSAVTVLAVFDKLAHLIMDFHARGIVMSDISPGNFILDDHDQLRVIDLEFAHFIGEPYHPRDQFWTVGFGSPQRSLPLSSPTPADDIFALGRLLFFMLTGLHPNLGKVPADRSTGERMLATLMHLRPDTPPAVHDLIRRCTEYEPGDRFASAADLAACTADLLRRLQQGEAGQIAVAEAGHESEAGASSGRPAEYLRLAIGTGEALLANAAVTDGSFAVQQQPVDGMSPLCLHYGPPGVALFLRDLSLVTGEPRFRQTAEAIADAAYTGVLRTRYKACAGLHMGYTGPAWLLAHLYQISHDNGLIERAETILGMVHEAELTISDLTHGCAGIGFIHLHLAKLTGDPAHMRRAAAFGDRILTLAEPGRAGFIWPLFGPNEHAYGFAHGVAGIAYYLLELGQQAQEERFLEGARAGLKELAAVMERNAETGELSWPRLSEEPGNPWPWTWCNGVFGVGSLMIQAHRILGDAGYLDAARAVAGSARNNRARAATRPIHQCCGVPGIIEYLLDLYLATHEARYLQEAQWWGDLLAFRSTERNGRIEWPTGAPDAPTVTGFMVGSGGIASCLLRLADPEKNRRQWALPLAGFGSWPRSH